VGYVTVINLVLYFCIYQLLDNKNMTADEYTMHVFISGSGYAVLHVPEDPFHCILICICRHTSRSLLIIVLQVFRVNKQVEQYMKEWDVASGKCVIAPYRPYFPDMGYMVHALVPEV